MTSKGVTQEERAVANIYNAAVAASAISAAWELGALDELQEHTVVDSDDFAARHDLEPLSTLGLFRALAAVDIVERKGTKITAGTNFAEVLRNRSFFHWLTRGNADLFERMPEMLRNENRTGDYYQRDSAAIARACREISTFCYDPWFYQALDGLDQPVTTVADLGCGSGARLFQVLRRFPGARAIGIDIAEPALEVAREAAAEAGLADRAEFLRADARDLDPHPELASVDLLTCFMMGHDFWPREQCVKRLRNLADVFPNAHTLLLGDATRTVDVADADLPVFTLGFEVAHDMMGTFIPTVRDWESVFEEGGWKLRTKHSINITVGEVIFELERL